MIIIINTKLIIIINTKLIIIDKQLIIINQMIILIHLIQLIFLLTMALHTLEIKTIVAKIRRLNILNHDLVIFSALNSLLLETTQLDLTNLFVLVFTLHLFQYLFN